MTLETSRKHTIKRGPYGSRKPPKVAPLMMGRELAQMRARAGLSQAELARRLRQLRQTVNKWERESQPIPRHHYQAILDVCTAAKVEYDTLHIAMLTTF